MEKFVAAILILMLLSCVSKKAEEDPTVPITIVRIDTVYIEKECKEQVKVNPNAVDTLQIITVPRDKLDDFWRYYPRDKSNPTKRDWYTFWMEMEEMFPETIDGTWDLDDKHVFSPRLIKFKKRK